MAESNLDGLYEARKRLVAARLDIALRTANTKLKAEDMCRTLVELQGGIDVIDRAIEEEKKKQPSVYERRGLLGA